MKSFFGIQINTKVFYTLLLLFWVWVTRHAQSTENMFPYLYNISRKAWGMKLIFCLQINTKVFYELIVSLWVCVVRHAQSIQNDKFTISLQYFSEIVKDEVDFLPADKVKGFFKVAILFWGVSPGMPKLPKITSLLFLCSYFFYQ